MSRSYKKTPRSGDRKNSYFKRYANKVVRKIPYDRVLQHKAYKKAYCSWNICDYEEIGTTYRDYLARSWIHDELDNCEKNYQAYLRYYIRK